MVAGMQTVEVPVVECLLAAAVCHQSLHGFSFANESFRLTAFDPLAKKRLTKGLDFKLGVGDSWHERLGTPPGRMGLLDAGQPIRQLSVARAGMNEFAPALGPVLGRRQRAFKLRQLPYLRLEGAPALILFYLENAQQTTWPVCANTSRS